MSLIKILMQVFSQYGLPLKIISDNGPLIDIVWIKELLFKTLNSAPENNIALVSN